jgi:hypothetical protein
MTYLGGDLCQLRDWDGLGGINVSGIVVIAFRELLLLLCCVSNQLGVYSSGNAV